MSLFAVGARTISVSAPTSHSLFRTFPIVLLNLRNFTCTPRCYPPLSTTLGIIDTALQGVYVCVCVCVCLCYHYENVITEKQNKFLTDIILIRKIFANDKQCNTSSTCVVFFISKFTFLSKILKKMFKSTKINVRTGENGKLSH